MRLFHVKPQSDDHQALYHWAVKGWDGVPDQPPAEAMEQIWWYERLRQDPSLTLDAIRMGRLTHEMVAPIGNMTCEAWQLLFESMPLGATLRNLGSLTEIGVLKVHGTKNLDRLEARLQSKKLLRKARIHPIDVLKAIKTYESGGALGRSQKTWTPIPRVLDILEGALEGAFQVQEPTHKVFLHAIDISGSMSWWSSAVAGLKCSEIAAALALATAKAEKNYIIRGFSTQFVDLDITARDSFRSALKKTANHTFGGTDASVAYRWAIVNKTKVDIFCFWTDSESWAGRSHPSQALAEYRRKVNPKAKAVYVTLQTNRITLVDPRDPNSFDFGGFDPSLSKAIQAIAKMES